MTLAYNDQFAYLAIKCYFPCLWINPSSLIDAYMRLYSSCTTKYINFKISSAKWRSFCLGDIVQNMSMWTSFEHWSHIFTCYWRVYVIDAIKTSGNNTILKNSKYIQCKQWKPIYLLTIPVITLWNVLITSFLPGAYIFIRIDVFASIQKLSSTPVARQQWVFRLENELLGAVVNHFNSIKWLGHSWCNIQWNLSEIERSQCIVSGDK